MSKDLSISGHHDDWWIALITFENDGDVLGILSPEQQGAAGWMAGRAENEDQLAERIGSALSEVGLRLVSIEDERTVGTITEIEEIDEHLADNMRNRETNEHVVWGSLHPFLAEGEA